jgi:hypothetical protein
MHAAPRLWVVYEKVQPGRPRTTAICLQSEWDAMVLAQLKYVVLIRAGITNEGEAERLARSGVVVEKVVRKRPVVPATDAREKKGPQLKSPDNSWFRRRQPPPPENPGTASCVSE